jgi:MFS family permease
MALASGQKSEVNSGNSDAVISGQPKKRLSYGWVVAAAGFVVILAGCNFQYTFGVFVVPLIIQFGWSRAAISGAVTARSLVGLVVSTPIGAMADRFGPHRLILVGLLMVGLAYLLMSRITELWQLYVFVGVFIGVGLCLVLIPMMATLHRWFGAKSAMANGLSMSGMSASQMIVPPLATFIILRSGWQECFVVIAVGAWVIGILAWLAIRVPKRATQPGTITTTKAAKATLEVEGFSLKEALRTRALWTVLTVQFADAACYQMFAVHVVAAAIDAGIGAASAAIILSLAGVTNTAGRLIISSLVSRVGARTILVACLLMQVASLFYLSTAYSLTSYYVVALLYGLGYGGLAPLTYTLAGSLFGEKSVGSLMGTVNTSFSAGLAVGPLLAGYLFDVTGSYSVAFVSGALTLAAACGFSLALKPPRKHIQAFTS